MRFFKRRAVKIAMTLAVVIGIASAASAISTYDNLFPSTNYNNNSQCQKLKICLADSSYHTVYFNSLGSGMKARTLDTMSHYNDVTVITMQEVATPVYTGASETDVIVENVVLSGDGIGRARCDDPSGGTNLECDQFYLSYDIPQISTNWQGNSQYKKRLACHELGHTLGLLHGHNATDSSSPPPVRGFNDDEHIKCMKKPVSISNTFVGNHNKWILSTHY